MLAVSPDPPQITERAVCFASTPDLVKQQSIFEA